jgi:hypothetical protein
MAVTSTNFSIDIVKEVLQSRTNLNIRNASDGELENLICEADKYLKNHVIFSLNVWLIIASPNEGNTESDKTQEVEVWMFKPYADSAQPVVHGTII